MRNFSKIIVALLLIISMTMIIAACGSNVQNENLPADSSTAVAESSDNGLTKPDMPIGSSEENSGESNSAGSESSQEEDEGEGNDLNENYFQSSVML